MNYTNTGAAKRHAMSPRSNAAGGTPVTWPITWPAVLSTIELRRLVATMVD